MSERERLLRNVWFIKQYFERKAPVLGEYLAGWRLVLAVLNHIVHVGTKVASGGWVILLYHETSCTCHGTYAQERVGFNTAFSLQLSH